jgi:hypothetical protein
VYRFNVFALLRQLEAKKGQLYGFQRVADAAGLHRNTVERLVNNRINGTDLGVLWKLTVFFRREGMAVSIGDLIVEVEDEAGDEGEVSGGEKGGGDVGEGGKGSGELSRGGGIVEGKD